LIYEVTAKNWAGKAELKTTGCF